MDPVAIREIAHAVLDTEARAVAGLKSQINDQFIEACRIMLACHGRIVVLGMGKSGHIGGKLAATLASTGSPAFFVHPGEASHGDLGMITRGDVVLMLSNSGETAELLTILPIIKRMRVRLVALTGNPDSHLARNADAHVHVDVSQEACPLGLAPTSSTTAALAMGDALAISLLEARGFTREDFARSHPAGQLGRRLLLHISDVMHVGDDIPLVNSDTCLADAVMEMSRKRLGMTTVVDEQRRVVGVLTDGDLRRAIDSNVDMSVAPVSDVMSPNPTSIRAERLAVEGAELMERCKITALPVLDEGGHVVGALNIHDLFSAGVL